MLEHDGGTEWRVATRAQWIGPSDDLFGAVAGCMASGCWESKVVTKQ
jgi:hypothetical protein